LTEDQSKNVDKDEMRQEIADIFIYLLRLADKLDIDIEEAVREKIEINAKKYPIDLSKGNAIKYNRR
jgi:NTP pyrophosphatase (non-canonical NTP hydrolase)